MPVWKFSAIPTSMSATPTWVSPGQLGSTPVSKSALPQRGSARGLPIKPGGKSNARLPSVPSGKPSPS